MRKPIAGEMDTASSSPFIYGAVATSHVQTHRWPTANCSPAAPRFLLIPWSTETEAEAAYQRPSRATASESGYALPQ